MKKDKYNYSVLTSVLESTFTGYNSASLDLAYLIAILSASFIIIIKNPVISVLLLIVLFLTISIFLILIGLNFLGLAYILVYIGAVSILFLFILMLINVRISELSIDNLNSIPLGLLICISYNYVISDVLPPIMGTFNSLLYQLNVITRLGNVTSFSWDGYLAETSHITSIGNILYGNFSIWLIITSIILLLAMVGAIIITLRKPSFTTFTGDTNTSSEGNGSQLQSKMGLLTLLVFFTYDTAMHYIFSFFSYIYGKGTIVSCDSYPSWNDIFNTIRELNNVTVEEIMNNSVVIHDIIIYHLLCISLAGGIIIASSFISYKRSSHRYSNNKSNNNILLLLIYFVLECTIVLILVIVYLSFNSVSLLCAVSSITNHFSDDKLLPIYAVEYYPEPSYKKGEVLFSMVKDNNGGTSIQPQKSKPDLKIEEVTYPVPDFSHLDALLKDLNSNIDKLQTVGNKEKLNRIEQEIMEESRKLLDLSNDVTNRNVPKFLEVSKNISDLSRGTRSLEIDRKFNELGKREHDAPGLDLLRNDPLKYWPNKIKYACKVKDTMSTHLNLLKDIVKENKSLTPKEKEIYYKDINILKKNAATIRDADIEVMKTMNAKFETYVDLKNKIHKK